MSAWVVSKEHIDLMVGTALAYGRVDKFRWWAVDAEGEYAGWRTLDARAESRGEEQQEAEGLVSPSRLGQMLVSENVASVSLRYPDDDPDAGELPGPIDAYYVGPYVYSDPGYRLSPGEVFKALDCYDYQSCEHDGWRKSEAFAFCAALRSKACNLVDGYEDGPWGWDAEELAKRRGARVPS